MTVKGSWELARQKIASNRCSMHTRPSYDMPNAWLMVFDIDGTLTDTCEADFSEAA